MGSGFLLILQNRSTGTNWHFLNILGIGEGWAALILDMSGEVDALTQLDVVEDCREYLIGGSSNLDPGCPNCKGVFPPGSNYIANYSGTNIA